MTNTNDYGRQLVAWKVESLRLTAFPTAGRRINPAKWYSSVFGQEPDNRITKAREGVVQDEGVIDNIKYVLAVGPLRMDWFAAPTDPEQDPTIGFLPDVIETFRRYMAKWLETAPPIRRLAFGTVLMQPVEDREAGYIKTAEYLKEYVRIDTSNSADFLYQINRPRMSRTPIKDLKINRLSRWTISKQGFGQIEVSMQQPKASYYPLFETFSCRLELDVNTDADYEQALSPDRLAPLFIELTELGEELAVKGDTP